MLNKDVSYSLDDVMIIPSDISYIDSRNECNVYDENGYLPIFTSPMPCVIDEVSYIKYEDNKIISIFPRTMCIEYRLTKLKEGYWCAFSLKEFEDIFINNEYPTKAKVLIDIANGNMSRMLLLSSKAKDLYGSDLTLMVGNVANYKTYKLICDIGIDYVRLSVGTGSSCCTATQTGVYNGMASLIDDCNKIKNELKKSGKFYTKIIADGGLSIYRNMIKALALGADYIMLGGRLNKCEDSAGEIVFYNDNYRKVYYGMASIVGMEKLDKKGIPEGKLVYNEIEGTINTFVTEFKGYLSSAMSYCNALSLKDFSSKTNLQVLSYNATKQFNREL